MEGTVHIMAMNLRGMWPERPPGQFVNATSAQATDSKNRRDLSPMTMKPVTIFGVKYPNMEAGWQSGKVFEDDAKGNFSEEKTKDFWLNVKVPKRRYPKSKGRRVKFARWLGNDEKMDYITSRKKVYVPVYREMMEKTEMAAHWRAHVQKGNDAVIADFDGPRLPDGTPTCLEVTEAMLREKLDDPRFPFGHGYVVAAHLKGIRL